MIEAVPWQRVLGTARTVIVLWCVVLYTQFAGWRHVLMDIGYLGALAALLLWFSYARPRRPWLQATTLMLMAMYGMVTPLAVAGPGRYLVGFGGLLLPVTLAVAAYYFSSRVRPEAALTRPGKRLR